MRNRNQDWIFEFFVLVITNGFAVFVVKDFNVFPLDVRVIADRLDDRLFCGEPAGEMLKGIAMTEGIFNLFLAVHMIQKMVSPALDGPGDSRHFDNINPNPVNHVRVLVNLSIFLTASSRPVKTASAIMA